MSKQAILSLASRATWAHKASLIVTIQLSTVLSQGGWDASVSLGVPAHSQLSQIVIAPTHRRMSGWADLGGWLNTKMVQTRIEPANVTQPGLS